MNDDNGSLVLVRPLVLSGSWTLGLNLKWFPVGEVSLALDKRITMKGAWCVLDFLVIGQSSLEKYFFGILCSYIYSSSASLSLKAAVLEIGVLENQGSSQRDLVFSSLLQGPQVGQSLSSFVEFTHY